MRRSMVFGAAIAATLLGGASAMAAPAPAPQGDVAKGKANFQRVGCWECHGHQGQGGNAGTGGCTAALRRDQSGALV